MKVFISWSGELSKLVAKELSEWLPSIIQSVEVFYSPEDIQKGENWDSRLTKELEECKYGIVCLTKENVSAPWVHFEAGALSKSLDSHTSALMIDVVTSDIQGPLARFQATRFDKDDFYQLICGINDASDNKILDKVLKNSFEAIWDKMEVNINDIIKKHSKNTRELNKEKSREQNDILEELLQLSRKQDAVINNPEKLFPVGYFENLFNYFATKDFGYNNIEDISTFFDFVVRRMYPMISEDDTHNNIIIAIDICMSIVIFIRKNKRAIKCDAPTGMLIEIADKLQDLQDTFTI
ncbi:MAG: toll/interleukin-1 receptor domain-containing protein [bacterium]|nr:toll/interleukin-1 receptor domain-containing protein [bacterium]MCM1375144.1 toll/interleukin-1 receptor domain-containing protein [Muribaculum sp.]